MMRKIVIKGSALLLAFILLLSVRSLPEAKAAAAVGTEASCSAEFIIGGEFEELRQMKGGILIRLYQVASINKTGAYTAKPGFEELDLSLVQYDNSQAEIWSARAQEAHEMIKQDTVPAVEAVTNQEGTASVTDIPTGLYLVAAEAVMSDYYHYSFTPYLLSLPSNYYYTNAEDTWIYDLTGKNAAGLKPEQTKRYGSLIITKELVSHHVTLGQKATFVFQVDITERKGKKESKQIVMGFDGCGKRTASIENIPAGSEVTVAEIYSSGGYSISKDSALVQNTVITADAKAETYFKNEHDGRLLGGYGVVNNFKLNEHDQYDWKKMYDNSGEQE